jgi:hypothetical protein
MLSDAAVNCLDAAVNCLDAAVNCKSSSLTAFLSVTARGGERSGLRPHVGDCICNIKYLRKKSVSA